MSFSLRGVAWTAFAAAVALLVGCSIYLVRATNRFSTGEALVGHTREVQTLVENMGAEVFQASNSAEAFVLTGDQTLLAGYNGAVAKIPGDINTLRYLTSDNSDR
ncbi:MAG TPA: CHASE3 domain-containing protein, partial [Terriglobales bacterium]|nr:CHASE3 domain-containing protein [Terriglobales bacterium]